MSTIAVSTRRFPVVQSFIRPVRLHTGATLLSKGKRARVAISDRVPRRCVLLRCLRLHSDRVCVQTSTTSLTLVISFVRYRNTGSEFVLLHPSHSRSLSSLPELFKRVCPSFDVSREEEILESGESGRSTEEGQDQGEARIRTWFSLPRRRDRGAPFDVSFLLLCRTNSLNKRT